MFGFGVPELFVVVLMLIAGLPFIIYQPVCIGLISKKLGFNPWLMGLLSLIPIVNLVVLGVLAFSREKKGIA